MRKLPQWPMFAAATAIALVSSAFYCAYGATRGVLTGPVTMRIDERLNHYSSTLAEADLNALEGSSDIVELNIGDVFRAKGTVADVRDALHEAFERKAMEIQVNAIILLETHDRQQVLVQFTQIKNSTGTYRWRASGGTPRKMLNGVGHVVDKFHGILAGSDDPWSVKIGNVELDWPSGGAHSGHIYYETPVFTVRKLSPDEFDMVL